MKNKIMRTLSRIHRCRLLVLLLAVLISLTLVLSTTFSWFTQSDKITNTLETKDLGFSFKVNEVFSPPGTITPGQDIEKVVNVKNTGDMPGFVRVLVLAEIISADGDVLEAKPGVTFAFKSLNVTDWTPGNKKMWADGKDGYYYYLDKLEPGQTTKEPLFSGVMLNPSLGPEYENASMKIEIKVEASETAREKYRGGWWRNGDNPPASPALKPIDDTLKGLA